jgi:hypothetical protein
LLAIAELVGGEWIERSRQAAKVLVAAGKDVEPSLGIRLLADVKEIFGDADSMPSKELLVRLNALAEAPWGDMKGKPLDERGLARRLRQFDIKPKRLRAGEAILRGYSKEDFFDAWKRYVPPQSATPTPHTDTHPQKSATSATSATALNSNRFSVADKSNVADSQRHVADVADVALSAGGVCQSMEPCAQCGVSVDGC